MEVLEELKKWIIFEGHFTPLGLVIVALGAISLLKIILFILETIYVRTRSGKNLLSYGKWAVVTGATDGIGLGYAKELARKGLNVVIVSRNAERLSQTVTELKDKFKKVEFRTIQADLGSGDSEMFQRIENDLKDLDIGILVNNAGVSYSHAEFLNELDVQEIDLLIELNVRALTRITRIVVPGMVARKRGAIVNVGSAAGLIPSGDPLYAVYAGTKAYVDFFSRSLDVELRAKGVNVQCVVPYFVTSKLSKIRNASIGTPNPDTFARAAVDAIGYESSSVPYWSHAIQHFILTSLPNVVAEWYLLSTHLDIRKRALKKKVKST